MGSGLHGDLATRSATAWAPGTWGELVQGELAPGRRILLGLPSSHGALAIIRVGPRRVGEAPVQAEPGLERTARAVSLLLDVLGIRDLQVDITVRSSLRQGVGHASSSADLLAAMLATCRALRLPEDPACLFRIASRIEPTNPTLYPGACWADPDRGRVLARGALPRFRVVPSAIGAPVDTLEFHRRAPPWSAAARGRLRRIVERAAVACRLGDPRLLARAATDSALLHAERLGRDEIPRLLDRAVRAGALGIAVSHSGSSVVALHHPRELRHGC